ncbi:hypothetical protein ACHAXR_008212, partial [Thalassiosira sp. AJA248-18]
DADYLLSSSSTAGGVWNNLFSLTTSWWLPWITNNHHGEQHYNNQILDDHDHANTGSNSNGDSSSASAIEEGRRRREMLQKAMGRKKSQPSEASVQAVKNLLYFVQQQVVAVEENSDHNPSSSLLEETLSNHSSPPLPLTLSPPHSPKPIPTLPALPPSLSTPNPNLPPSFPDLKGIEDPRSFDSEPSYDPSIQASPVRASPKPSPGAHLNIHSSSPKVTIEPAQTVFSPVSKRSARASIIDLSKSSSSGSGMYDHGNNSNSVSPDNNQAMHAEMAARLAEGTLRAYRDLALDEATELHSALHHWTIRWDRPFLGWLEAGPDVWFSEKGYSPYHSGKKVSQIQAVLARRCAVIGEIQQHIWRANWQKGVAEWGMLGGGVGGEWTSVVGEFGGMEAPSSSGTLSSSTTKQQTRPEKQKLMKIFNHSSFVGKNVKNSPGGSIVVDQNALTTWSIDAIRVIRDQLYRAIPASQAKELPFVEHWPRERSHFHNAGGDADATADTGAHEIDLPLWAEQVSTVNDPSLSDASRAAAAAVKSRGDNNSSVIIADLNLMSNEVGALLQSVEIHLEQQRVRRLNRLRPASRLRRNWYLIAVGLPVGVYAIHKLTKEHGGFFLLKTCITKITDIYREHVSEPLSSIYQELFTKSGRIDVTDRKARIDAIESLKRMIRSWLEESFPKMDIEEQIQRAETMDISLIEEKMEESIKHIYELNSVVRMSLIEMQFIKKELLSALVAMDELMGSNEINMRIAAMTPAVILLVAIRRAFRLLFYAFFQVGKSKEDIYSSFRQTILDIERLLVMRDNPPSPPASLEWGSTRSSTNTAGEIVNTQCGQKETLSAEDLGMLLLHIHECRNILWQSRRRFRSDVLRNVAEDLAELAGERGAVSVSQQLQIITRMARTYPFMKVVSSGVPFDMIIPGAG